MAELLKGEELERELRGREPLTGSIKLRERNSDSRQVLDDFEIHGVLHAGGSCICYKATRFFENSEMAETGTLKEFYPVDSPNDYELSYNLKRHDIDAGDLAKQLYSEQSTLSNFINGQNEFKKCYDRVSKLKLSDESNDNFFAPIRIYRGIPEKQGGENHTIYIWNPGDSSLKSFDDHLTEMHYRIKSAINNPEGDLSLMLARELNTVFKAVRSLAQGIENLHMANLLHLDIKPSNFGIRQFGNSVTVSLFDVNTIYSRGSSFARTGGTPYFRGPEMTGDNDDNYHRISVGTLSDIYSIGATLYNSLVLLSEGRGLFESKDFVNIDASLSRSLLMEYSEYNSNAKLHDAIVNILKRSLARSAADYIGGIENYESVGEFIIDLTSVIEMTDTQINMAVEAGSDNIATLQLNNKEDFYDAEIKGGAVGRMQCLLYDSPLYNYVDENGRLNLLVLGAGVFGQRFIDIAFELSQINGCYLDITVVTDEKQKDQARYLNSRPEFRKYFYVNGQTPEYDSYGALGNLTFVEIKSKLGKHFSCKDGNNIEILKETLGNTDKRFSYAFVSLSDDVLNCKLACDLSESEFIVPGKNSSAIINFVSYKDIEKETAIKNEKQAKGEKYSVFSADFDQCFEKAESKNIELNPVAVKSTLVNHRDYKMLSAMSFNCHLLWEDGINVDLKKVYGSFRSAYNNINSVANALSVKYKLHSIGLELDSVAKEKDRELREENLHKLTCEFREKLGVGKADKDKTEKQKQRLDELTMYEHRRWIVSMICSCSYEALTKEEFCTLKNSNKDKRNRKHTCIVPSSSEWSLNSSEWNDNLSKWDEVGLENTKEYQALDHLDKMSVDLHRHFMSEIKNFDISCVENDASIIRRYLSGDGEALAAFEAYMISLRAIVAVVQPTENGEKTEVKRKSVDNIQKALKRNLNRFKKLLAEKVSDKKEIEKRLKNIENAFATVVLAADYTDYKAKDQHLVYNIPFILNYSVNTKLCIPFVKGKSNNEWFENVASSIVINPSMVTYLVDIESEKMIIPTVKESLLNITRVMDGHNLQTKIGLILYTKVKGEQPVIIKKSEIEKELKDVSSRIHSVDIVEIRNQKDLVSRIRKTFETNQKSSARFSAIEVNGEFISGAIYSIEDLSVPTFEFNSRKLSFYTEDRDDGYIWFSDIPFNPHLNIEDLFASRDRLSVYREPELHKDYKDIWNKCYFDEKFKGIDKSMGWKALCTAIKKKIENDDVLLNLKVKPNNQDKDCLTDVFVPAFCRASLEKIFEFFISAKVQLISELSIKEHNSMMLRVTFSSSSEVKKAVMMLFRNPYILTDASKIKLMFNGRFAQVNFDSLVVNDFLWESVKAEVHNSNAFKCAKNSFEYLAEKGYIIRFSSCEDGEKESFCFASSQIKELLSNEGQLLEIYTYYQTLEKGFFDEIKTGLEVQYKKADSANDYVSTQEFDLIAIKGFRTQMVEVKARRKLQQEFYQKLKSNADKFGINKQLVLVSHTGDVVLSYENEEFVLRGKEDYDVKTIYKPGHIERIGKHLTEEMKKNSY